MTRLREALLLAIVAILAIICAWAGYEFIYPPFSDAEIQASFVDTWEPSALVTVVILPLLFLALAVSVALAWGCSRFTKRLATISLALGSASATLLIASHISLTERTTALTGQSFGCFYGLL